MANLYLDMNPLTNKPFYIGVGDRVRCYAKFRRNVYHINIVNTFPHKQFHRIILYNNIPTEQAYKLEKQIIKRCGRICNNTGFLTNIHIGGRFTTSKEMNGGYSKRERIKNLGYTENEIKGFKKTADSQRGILMCDRVGNPNWINKRKGKTFREQYGDDYVNPRKGRKQTEYDPNYINPTVKPFKLILNDVDTMVIWNSKEFIERTHLNTKILIKLRRDGYYIFRKPKWKYKHTYLNGDKLIYIPITVDEFMQLTTIPT